MAEQQARRTPALEPSKSLNGSPLTLTPYSPDLNPIEQFFAKLKALLRKAASRTRDALWDTIGTLLDEFPDQERRAYITNSGYGFV